MCMIRCRFAHNEQSGVLQIGKSVGGFGLENASNLQARFYEKSWSCSRELFAISVQIWKLLRRWRGTVMPARQRLPMTGSAEPRTRTPPVVTFACGPPNPISWKSYLRIRSTSGKLADRLEGRMSTGDSERACYGFGCDDMLLLKRTAKSSPLTYPGNLGRTCRRQIRHTANARTETFKKESRQSRKVSIDFVGRSRRWAVTLHCCWTRLLVCCKVGLCPTGSRARFIARDRQGF